jgi:integrase
MEFTSETIAALSLPADKSDQIWFDDTLPGFGIRLRAGGKRAWIIQYRLASRQRRVTIGDARKVKLRAARAEAEKRFAEVTLGRDPQAEKQAEKAKAALTVGPLVDKYLALKKTKVRKNTFVADERYLTHYWKPLRSLPVESVTRRMVAGRLNEIITERGSTAAARARQSLSAFFSWAIREGMVDGNPVIGTNDPASHIDARDRVLTADELRSIWLTCEDDDFGRIVRLLTLTGCRRDEIGGLRWSEIDLERGVLTVPGTRTKNHHTLILTLPPAALSILCSTSRRGDRDYVFGIRGGAYSAWSYSTLALNARIVKIGGAVAPWRLHDLRRTAATGMAELGIAPHVIEAILNHRSGHRAGVAGIYNRATYDAEIKRALAIWADHMLTLVEGAERKVVTFSPVAR